MHMRDLLLRGVQTIAQTVGSLVVPPMCSYCKIFLSQPAWLCSDCQYLVIPILSVTMPITSKYTMKVIALSGYADPLKALILAKNWRDIRASYVLGNLVWEHISAYNLPIDYIVPVPLHWTRYAHRGFNQAEQMARVIARHSTKPCVKLLTRTRRTVFQSRLAPNERMNNIKEAFSLRGGDVAMYEGKHLILVDDLMTTGATLGAAAKEIVKCKPASITALVACRVL